MIRSLKLLLTALLIVFVGTIALPAAGQSDDSVAESFAPLQKSFTNLHQSLLSEGGLAFKDRGIVESFREKVDTFVKQNPDYAPAVAVNLQLSMWLEESDRVDELFGRLVELRPDDNRLKRSWAGYFSKLGDGDRVDEIYAKLVAQSPDDIDLKVQWGRILKGMNRYTEACDMLKGSIEDIAQHPQAAVLLAECMYGDNRFEESLALLQEIDKDAIAADLTVSQQYDRVLPMVEAEIDTWKAEQELRAAEASADDLPRVAIETDRGRIVVELFENEAPNTVSNFINLAEADFYDGSKFHQVLANYAAHGGDPNTKPSGSGTPGMGSPGYYIPDEHIQEPYRKHFAGSLGMAKDVAPDSAGCQFYITHQPTPWLNGQQTVFGRVIDGLDVARLIQQDDTILSTEVIRKRDHPYVTKRLSKSDKTPIPSPGQSTESD